jgi:hypothetical protein
MARRLPLSRRWFIDAIEQSNELLFQTAFLRFGGYLPQGVALAEGGCPHHPLTM